MKIKPYVLGYSAYSQETFYKCKKCKCEFSSWELLMQKENQSGKKDYCPKCNVNLKLP